MMQHLVDEVAIDDLELVHALQSVDLAYPHALRGPHNSINRANNARGRTRAQTPNAHGSYRPCLFCSLHSVFQNVVSQLSLKTFDFALGSFSSRFNCLLYYLQTKHNKSPASKKTIWDISSNIQKHKEILMCTNQRI